MEREALSTAERCPLVGCSIERVQREATQLHRAGTVSTYIQPEIRGCERRGRFVLEPVECLNLQAACKCENPLVSTLAATEQRVAQHAVIATSIYN